MFKWQISLWPGTLIKWGLCGHLGQFQPGLYSGGCEDRALLRMLPPAGIHGTASTDAFPTSQAILVLKLLGKYNFANSANQAIQLTETYIGC